ncbi:hypothetical protein LWE61_11705 [Sphingobium sufflavum]|uniref:hypothetical protein n=1 Tax=Sphingobium sufflavum TaxID=1129547 RepID=UPI001F35E23D|nr:hypothetical protein [Sphingobium sufflavum]MCE7797222.1 hypothetical protein [Sphingobium sufflavum]
MSALLPPGFATLEPFAMRWAGETAADRAHLRAAYPDAERDAFHAACAPRLEAGLAHLDETPLAALDEAQQRLMRLLLTFAHVSLAVEVQGPDEAQHAPLRASMRITRTPADR